MWYCQLQKTLAFDVVADDTTVYVEKDSIDDAIQIYSQN